MEQELDFSHLQQESYDIYLCTRGLPDALTPETAAVRQLMSALAGSGYRVFFPSALPRELPAEDLAAAMAAAARSTPVMIAAAVGDEGAQDPTARFLWKRFREMGREDPSRRFIVCVRDLSALPEELEGAETLDMGELDFLTALRERLEAALPGRAPEPAAEEPQPPETEEDPEPESAGEEEEAPEPEDPVPAARRRKRFLALAIAGAALVLLCLALLLFKH